jgi:hypothetical protein
MGVGSQPSASFAPKTGRSDAVICQQIIKHRFAPTEIVDIRTIRVIRGKKCFPVGRIDFVGFRRA